VTTVPIRPFLKWPGGKYRLIKKLLQALPPGKILIEPFVGAGSVFLNTDYPKYLLNDINPDLIHLLSFLKREGSSFIQEAHKFFTPQNNTPKKYYTLRQCFNQSQDPFERALLFLYLNRHGYNGLCRYNLKGLYNVPFGCYKNPYFPETEMLAFHKKARKAQFISETFHQTFKRITKLSTIKECVIYCDPPYAPLSDTAFFTQYAPQAFPLSYQNQLAQVAQEAANAGAMVFISNHDTEFTRSLYSNAQIISFTAQRIISCDPKNRKPVKELIACYGPL